MDKENLLNILRVEVQRSTGCTDPGSVALAVARAVVELGLPPERIEVLVSPSVYKNGVGVGIPGTGMRGLDIAAALGAVLACPEAGLAIFDGVSAEALALAKALVDSGRARVGYGETPDPLYVKAEVFHGARKAHAVIAGDYANFIELGRDGAASFSSPLARAMESQDGLAGSSLEALLGLVDAMTEDDLGFLLEAADINLRAAEAGLASPDLRLGPALAGRGRVGGKAADLPQPFAAMHLAQVWTAAASEARMAGLPVTIMAIAGSGNHGITYSLGVLAVARTLGVSRDRLAAALAYAALVTVVIKSHVHRMTAFCGCSVAASTGLAAATVHLLGGGFPIAQAAMQSVIGTLSGMLCDGAKESCAYKLSTSASLAIQCAFAAMEGASIPGGMGIVGPSIEESFVNLGQLNNPGMVATNSFVLGLIERNSSSRLEKKS